MDGPRSGHRGKEEGVRGSQTGKASSTFRQNDVWSQATAISVPSSVPHLERSFAGTNLPKTISILCANTSAISLFKRSFYIYMLLIASSLSPSHGKTVTHNHSTKIPPLRKKNRNHICFQTNDLKHTHMLPHEKKSYSENYNERPYRKTQTH